MKDKLDIAALSPGDLARLLSQSLKKTITEEQVREIAEAGDLISSDNQTINLIEFTAYLANEVNYAPN